MSHLCNIWMFTVKYISKQLLCHSNSCTHAYPFSHNLHKMIYFGHEDLCYTCIIKKSNQKFLWICTCTQNVHTNYKVTWNSVEQFCWQTVYLILDKPKGFKFKRGIIPRGKNWIKSFCKHFHSMSFINTKFHEILLKVSEELW